VAALTLASLAWFNHDAGLDAWAPYFFTAYGLGVLAAWARQTRALAWLFGSVCALHLIAATLQDRPRVLLAVATAIVLAAWGSSASARVRGSAMLAYWGDASYGVFLIHYAVIVATTALWLHFSFSSAAAAWSLLLACWIASLAAGAALQRWVGALLRPGRARRAGASALQ
jgi:peptidoglycan/LPS O-acetylase OafA/YrhL